MTHIFSKLDILKFSVVFAIFLFVSTSIEAKSPKTVEVKAIQETTNQVLKAVRGFVVDEFGEPMVGVQVEALGSLNSAITNTEGKYNLLANIEDVLKFSQLGVKAKEEKIMSSRIVNVELVIE